MNTSIPIAASGRGTRSVVGNGRLAHPDKQPAGGQNSPETISSKPSHSLMPLYHSNSNAVRALHERKEREGTCSITPMKKQVDHLWIVGNVPDVGNASGNAGPVDPRSILPGAFSPEFEQYREENREEASPSRTTEWDALSGNSGDSRERPATSRGRAAVARQSHNLEVAGSNPAPATTPQYEPNGRGGRPSSPRSIQQQE